MDGSSVVVPQTLVDVIHSLMSAGESFQSIRHGVQRWVSVHAHFPCRTYVEKGEVVVVYSTVGFDTPVRVRVPMLPEYQKQVLVPEGW